MPLIFDWTTWSEWIPLTELDLGTIPNKPGTYVVATRTPITRVLGSDPEGFLDVGESSTLRKRIASFLTCAQNPNAYGHMAGIRFALMRFGELFPVSTLWIRYAVLETKELAYAAEGALLKHYTQEHRELPPLNYKYNWSAHE